MAPHAHAFSCSLTKVALSSIDRRLTLQNLPLRHALNTECTLSALRCSASKPRFRCLSRPCSLKASTETTSHDDRYVLLVPLPTWASPSGPGPEPVTNVALCPLATTTIMQIEATRGYLLWLRCLVPSFPPAVEIRES